jgi:hypothetical protein
MRVLSGFLISAACLAGCSWDAPPVEWASPAPIASAVDTAARFRGRWAPGASQEVQVARAESSDSTDRLATLSGEAGACPGSRVEAPLVRGSRWASWWQVRPDSSALLIAEQRDTLGVPLQRVSVDSVDRALLGCARPAPSVAVDSVNGYVHIGYFMVAPEGPGVFYAHLMNPTQRFEPPIAIVYGEKPVRIAVASQGDTVALAYEDPNSERGRIALSMSTTAGHLFAQTARLIPVSTSSQHASSPEIVRLSGQQLWVGWTESSQSGSAYLLRRAQIVAR